VSERRYGFATVENAELSQSVICHFLNRQFREYLRLDMRQLAVST